MNRFQKVLDSMPYIFTPRHGESETTYEIVETIKEALEKQIPQRVIEESIGLDCFLRYCPSCGVRFLRINHPYCGECGQALKWSDEENG